METRELLELVVLSNLADNGNSTVIDGRRILTAPDGTRYDFDKVEQRASELLFKFVEPYKVKE